ncbi:MAG: hypothetical protein ACREJ2_14270 [Planctomycetota bacterium]
MISPIKPAFPIKSSLRAGRQPAHRPERISDQAREAAVFARDCFPPADEGFLDAPRNVMHRDLSCLAVEATLAA